MRLDIKFKIIQNQNAVPRLYANLYEYMKDT